MPSRLKWQITTGVVTAACVFGVPLVHPALVERQADAAAVAADRKAPQSGLKAGELGRGGEKPCTTEAASTMKAGDSLSASSVEALGRDVSSITPRIPDAGQGSPPERLLRPIGAQGHFGPVGPWGPLGRYGPLGADADAGDRWLKLVRGNPLLDWFTESFASSTGPQALGPNGPLGPKGPVSKTAYCSQLPGINSYAKQLQAGGIYAPLGPTGALGPYGLLGPLGPRGSLAKHFDPGDGNYRKDGRVLRKVPAAVPWSSSTRRLYPLVENYPAGKAPRTGLDTSFAATDTIKLHGTKRYRITSDEAQFVTVLLVPDGGFKTLRGMLAGPIPALSHPANFGSVDYEDVVVYGSRLPSAEKITDGYRLSVTDGEGREVGVSDTKRFANWTQIKVPRAAHLTVNVTLRSVWEKQQPTPARKYRLVVTGATDWTQATDITGDHLNR
jgi:hypothetical protein